jgi:hypothetical protein
LVSALERVLEAGADVLARGGSDVELEAAFLAAASGGAEAVLRELGFMVRDALGRLGLAEWSGGRLGADFAGFGKLSEGGCVEALVFRLATGDGQDEGRLGWLGGSLFRGGRLPAYARAAVGDVGHALALVRCNVGTELQALRKAADPVGAALYDNLHAAAVTSASERPAALAFDSEAVVLARGPVPLAAEAHGAEVFTAALEGDPAMVVFHEAVARNEARPEGMRNRPLRGKPFEEPLVARNYAWADSDPADPACDAVGLSALANLLRTLFPAPEGLRETRVSRGEDGEELWPEEARVLPSVEAGPAPLRDSFTTWREAVEVAPGLSKARRAKLLAILEVTERVMLDALGDPPQGWQAGVRDELGIKPQTFSDDWKTLRGLNPVGAPR